MKWWNELGPEGKWIAICFGPLLFWANLAFAMLAFDAIWTWFTG